MQLALETHFEFHDYLYGLKPTSCIEDMNPVAAKFMGIYRKSTLYNILCIFMCKK